MSTSLRKAGICARYAYRNLRSLVRGRLRLHGGDAGATHQSLSVAQSIEYLHRVFSDYLLYGGVSKQWLRDKRILEIGPGDNLGVALLLVACGARQVTCLDRFETPSDPAQLRRIYETLRGGLAPEEQKRFDEAIDLRSLQMDPQRIRLVIGIPVERAAEALEAGSFDWIISRAVLEEVSKPKLAAALAALDRLLAPGGRLAHKIDLRDYGIFSSRGFHPLEYFTLPAWLHGLMSSHEPAPNRQRASAYRSLVEQLGYRTRIYVTHLAGIPDEIEPHWRALPADARVETARRLVTQIRPRLAAQFRSLSDEDLMTAGIFLAAEKPAVITDAPSL